ncbi:MAG TPA: thiamine phosphate synthase [Candidatus Cybelea sp.]|jgi:thiamine-phosphate pyrophosphorylase|nr:thiamine phosphate synthase [Candidatus Cybelea sp.]
MATDAVAHVTRARRAALLHGIYAIVDDGERTLALAQAALDARVRLVQYRAKNGLDAPRLQRLREMTRQCGALLILNDDWRAARTFDCDGVHLGPGDDGYAHPSAVRAALPECIVGLSCGTPEEVRSALPDEVDYLGIGSVFATASKADAGAPLGIAGLRELVVPAPLPVAAIGGISAENLADVRATGVAMAAVISALSRAAQPRDAARELVARWG